MNVFEHYAQYYDLLYQDKDYKTEAAYIDRLIKKYNPRAESVFEMGCGTGKHATLFAQKGYCVHGIDFSQHMIDLANENKKKHVLLQDRLDFSFGDIRSVKLHKTFDVALSLFHVMSYQITNKDLIESFCTAHEHLEKGGIFIFDCWYGPAVLHSKPSVRVKRLENDFFGITRLAEPKSYPHENRVDVNYQVYVIAKKTQERFDFKEVHKMRYLFKPEVEMLLKDTGFTLIGFEDWQTGKDPGINSWGVCFVCKKE